MFPARLQAGGPGNLSSSHAEPGRVIRAHGHDPFERRIERYARQIVLRGVGGPGQNRLKAARVLVIGAGGLGSPALQYLAGAGVGTLGIVDDDRSRCPTCIARSCTAPATSGGRRRERGGRDRAAQPACAVEQIALGSMRANARELVAALTSCSTAPTISTPATRSPTPAIYERRPLVAAALGEFDGTLTTLKPYENGAGRRPNPTYRCLFPEAPPPGMVPTCAEAGVLGALGGVLGSLMALEAIREIVGGFGDGDAAWSGGS